LVSITYLGLTTIFLLLLYRCRFVDVGRSLWREDGSTIYNCCWSTPTQSFLGTSSAGLMTIFYCLRFETPPTWRTRSPYLYPPGTVWPGYTPRHWVPISSPPTTRRASVEIFDTWKLRNLPFVTSRRTEYRSPSGIVHLLLHLFVVMATCLSELSASGLLRLSEAISHYLPITSLILDTILQSLCIGIIFLHPVNNRAKLILK
jgi:hypothetical protein